VEVAASLLSPAGLSPAALAPVSLAHWFFALFRNRPLTDKALRQVDWSRIDVLVLEKLKHGKAGGVLSPIQQAPVTLAPQGL